MGLQSTIHPRKPPASIAPLIHVALVAFLALELFDVFVRLPFGFGALLLDDFAQGRIHIFGHAAGVAAYENMRAFSVEPFPNLSRIFQHFVLDVRLASLVARPRAIAAREKPVTLILF